jgi:hypothetical protein
VSSPKSVDKHLTAAKRGRMLGMTLLTLNAIPQDINCHLCCKYFWVMTEMDTNFFLGHDSDPVETPNAKFSIQKYKT